MLKISQLTFMNANHYTIPPLRKFLYCIFSLMTVLHHCRYVKPPIFTLCVGNAWGEAALLLAAGSRGNRSALPSSTIMMKQVFLG